MLKLSKFLAVVLACCAFAVPQVVQADVVTEWNDIALDAIRLAPASPPVASRALAIVHIAVYDAVNGIEQTHEAYHVEPDAPEGASVEAAAAAAAHATLVALFPAQAASFDAELEASLAAIDEGEAKDDGVAWGEEVAAAILALRASDRSTDVVVYTPGTDPGDWQPTPPGFAAGVLPQWGLVVPFGAATGWAFRGDGPPALNSTEYADAFNEVKELGSADSTTRTEEQTEIAQFWINGPGTWTPPGHWNDIAQTVSAAENLSLAENARLFALLNIALADAAIVSWDNKYVYNHWRPVTAIQQADLDGNDLTEADADWLSFIPTPAFPEYTSGHSTFSGAASRILEHFLGTDDIAFSSESDVTPGLVRSYSSFSEAADESGRSRIYGGIHFQYANEDGLASGRALADYVSETYLQPVDDGDGNGNDNDNGDNDNDDNDNDDNDNDDNDNDDGDNGNDNGSGGFARLCGIFGFGNLALTLGLLSLARLIARRRAV